MYQGVAIIVKVRHNTEERMQSISIWLCWLVYTCTYLGKYSYNANISLIEDDFSISHTESGTVLTFFALFYGVGQIVNGLLCKKYSKKYIVPFSLLISALANLIFFLGVPFWSVKYLWTVEAIVLSILWPLIMQIISENVSAKYMSKAVLILSTTTSVGTLLSYGISALNVGLGNYKATFAFSAIILTLVSAIWLLLYKPGDYLAEAKKEFAEDSSNFSNLSGGWLLIPMVLFVLLVIIAVFAKDGLQSWAPVILKQVHHMPDSFSILLTLALPLFGILGATVAVSVSKKVKTYILLTLLFFICISLFNLIVVIFSHNLFVMVICFGTLEFLIHGVINIIVSVFPLAIRGKISSGTLSGILNGSSYAGSAASSFLLGNIADKSGWNAVFLTLFISAMIACLLNAAYLLFTNKKTELKI